MLIIVGPSILYGLFMHAIIMICYNFIKYIALG